MPRKNMIFFVSIACLFLFSCESKRDSDYQVPAEITEAEISEESITKIEQSSPIADPADVSSIDAIIQALYDSISFSEGEEPDLDRFQSLFMLKAPFICLTQDGVDTMDLESFVSSFRERIKSGAIKSFYEAEIARTSNAFGSIAQVFSTYNKGINTEDPELFTRGINSIQLYYDGRQWWVSSILWEDERSDSPIPKEYLR
ncbi:MAG: hypothetical protein ACETWK_04565 [Candidatus Aminicenantaceae bacterium]